MAHSKEVLKVSLYYAGSLAGSVGGACDSWSQDCEFKPYIGYGNYLNSLKKKKKYLCIMKLDPDRKPPCHTR